VLRAARAKAGEPSPRAGPPQDVAEPLHQLLFVFCVMAGYLKRCAFFSLTFGCDGAKAAAPIAKANTAFILDAI
jgi:hypothetical protein